MRGKLHFEGLERHGSVGAVASTQARLSACMKKPPWLHGGFLK
jgi:hypothetical protein